MAERATALHGVGNPFRTRIAPARLIAQLLCYAAFGLVIGYFADSPAYRYLAPDSAVLKLSFNHAGAHRTACRRRSPAELAALAPNMRQVVQCARARVPLRVELDLDGRRLYGAELRPGGLAKDGESSVYQRFTLPAGKHRLAMRLRDSRRRSGFDYAREVVVDLAPGQIFVIDFNAKAGGFQFPAATPVGSPVPVDSKPVGAVGRRGLRFVQPLPRRTTRFRGATRIALARGHRFHPSRSS